MIYIFNVLAHDGGPPRLAAGLGKKFKLTDLSPLIWYE